MDKMNLRKTLLLVFTLGLVTQSRVDAKELSNYLDEELEYYAENKEQIYSDIIKGEIIIDERGNSYNTNLYYDLDFNRNKIKYKDIVYIDGVGNSSCYGDGINTKNIPLNNINPTLGVVVGVKTGMEYPYAVAFYDESTNTIGDVIGWYKHDNIYAANKNMADVIEMPVCKNLTSGLCYEDYDKDGNIINHYCFLEGVKRIGDSGYGITIDYCGEEKEGYYIDSINGYYVNCDGVEKIEAKVNIGSKVLQKKFNIINR